MYFSEQSVPLLLLLAVIALAVLQLLWNRLLRDSVATRTAELHAANQTLAAQATRLGDLYNNVPCGYHSLDANGVIVEINNTALRWLGHTRDEIVGKREFAEFLTGECRDRFRTAFARFKAGNPVSVSSREQTFELRCGDGSCRTVAITSSMVVDGAGGYLMSRSTVYDITQQERAAQALRAEFCKLVVA